MTGVAAVIVKIMPSSPEVDLDKIKSSAKELMEEQGAKNISFEEQPIAFGIVAIILKMAWDEEKNTDLIDNTLSKIEGVTSVSIEDYRRAFG